MKISDLPEKATYNDIIAEHCFYVDFDDHMQPISRIKIPDLIMQQQETIKKLKEYLVHKLGCPLRFKVLILPLDKCSCGLDELLKKED